MLAVVHLDNFTIDIDDTIRDVEPKNGDLFTAEEIHELIEANEIEEGYTLDGHLIYFDPTNKGKKNVRATLLYKFGYNTPIYGKALVTK